MKLRIRDNSLRLRITQTELDQFEKDKKVQATIHFPEGVLMHYVLLWSDDENFGARFDGLSMVAWVSHSAGQRWLDPSEVTIDHSLELENGDSLRLLVEKDFQCLSERKDEDESDMFANPNTHC
jgi:hypothetical protein